jgi:hypothetical protein
MLMQRFYPRVREHLKEPWTARFHCSAHLGESAFRIPQREKERRREGVHDKAFSTQPLQPLQERASFVATAGARQGIAMNGRHKVEVRRPSVEILR